MENVPYWIVFGDVHDDLSGLGGIPELAGAEGIIVTGDITFAGGVKKAEKVMEAIAASVPRVYAQVGNMDKPEVTGWLEERGWNLHAKGRTLFPGVVAVGVGTSPPTPFNTPGEYPEEQLMEWMEAGLAEGKKLLAGQESLFPDAGERIVLVSHAPPYGTACDRLGNGTPVGSSAVREFIEKHRPALCLCGHIHESRGTDYLGAAHILNPGPLSEGGYVILSLEGADRAAQLKAELKIR